MSRLARYALAALFVLILAATVFAAAYVVAGGPLPSVRLTAGPQAASGKEPLP